MAKQESITKEQAFREEAIKEVARIIKALQDKGLSEEEIQKKVSNFHLSIENTIKNNKENEHN